MDSLDYTFSVAPMMDWTTRHCRAFHRCLSKKALLWTEMVTADAVIHGDRDHIIGFSRVEHPIVLQLGGNEPSKMVEAAKIAEQFGYDEVNINCGCPSDRVQSGAFGACLMRSPKVVAECVAAMKNTVSIPVSVKCRIGVDEDDPRTSLFGFVELVSAAGCNVFSVHARKAWLQGLSPKENRDIPPLDYDLVHELKAMRPDLTIVLNGGLQSLDECKAHLENLNGVMLGRAAYQVPAILGDVDTQLFQGKHRVAPTDAVEAFKPYIAARLNEGVPLHAMTRHMLGLFAGQPGAKLWRRTLSEHGRGSAGIDVLDAALAEVVSRAA